MNTVILSTKQFEKLEKDIAELKLLISSNQGKSSLSESWLDVQETCFALKISKRTLQTYRDNKVLPFSQIGGKIYFKTTDIEAHLNKHYVNNSKSR